jgi:protein-S-isoprenylcysteine O-methyltransferase Ste14
VPVDARDLVESVMLVFRWMIFAVGTVGIIWVSRASLRDVHHHGFYRFLSWESILILFVLNVNSWFVDPFSFQQIISWTFLMISLVLIGLGVQAFRRKGAIDLNRDDPALVGIEKTTQLVTTGVYQTIRHPFYSSLLFLGWGIFLKSVNWPTVIFALVNTVLIVKTAQKEEDENIEYFGEKYRLYMKQTKMFIPYIF